MESKLTSLVNKKDSNWLELRQDSIHTRNTLTDTIKEFIEYSIKQGSRNAHHYYANITKMEYKALRLSELYGEEKNLRDKLKLMDLSFLIVAENLCKLSLEEGMDNKLPYKDIYQITKDRIINYTNSINILRFSPTQMNKQLVEA